MAYKQQNHMSPSSSRPSFSRSIISCKSILSSSIIPSHLRAKSLILITQKPNTSPPCHILDMCCDNQVDRDHCCCGVGLVGQFLVALAIATVGVMDRVRDKIQERDSF
ncbi:hypothetical protein HBI56_057510 [Parastagonospora nodorum]|uniref:Uncharacterized protein n=1 Tax=Phaeosphaeria nodorum (strain SN15 / ATCC MYA-4574 / FGSC 10173) TaxID=321614 RepID=A0A7U2IC82_PHANO|nr:hypothetical protein HBH56_094630 [Parastagonospora nodorum]QRD07105.1 hypothetical protein JI435_446890 [Parastagonospora nodorum SN15]KAH3930485.1 hypothetical protein HBH54_108950 [Parastagonospora nodorum]KAH3945090.1 hypothetical protein HBH53_150490 [Parastagonospora nodorum]KAH3981451.1 hypothetical protein HBH52_082410 [Parastagonospora nodorum]